jgi:hypothetical protein
LFTGQVGHFWLAAVGHVSQAVKRIGGGMGKRLEFLLKLCECLLIQLKAAPSRLIEEPMWNSRIA